MIKHVPAGYIVHMDRLCNCIVTRVYLHTLQYLQLPMANEKCSQQGTFHSHFLQLLLIM